MQIVDGFGHFPPVLVVQAPLRCATHKTKKLKKAHMWLTFMGIRGKK